MSDEAPPKAAWQTMGGTDRPIRPPFMDRQVQNLLLLKGLLEEALVAKQRDLERAQIALARLKHGGGR